MRRIIVIMLVVGLPVIALAAAWETRQKGDAGTDTLELMFRVCQSDVDLNYADNSIRLEKFMNRLCRLDADRRGDYYIKVTAGASPEGPAEQNRRVGERRAEALRQLLTQSIASLGMDTWHPHIQVTNEGARWARLYHDVSQSNETWRHRVLAILRQPASARDEWALDNRELQLRSLDGGSVWHQLQERYLPQLRSVGTAMLVPLTARCYHRDTLVIRDTVYYMPCGMEVMDSLRVLIGLLRPSSNKKGKPEKEPRPVLDDPTWSLKTNLLFLGTATPNLEFEHSLGKTGRWSITTEAAFAWWKLDRGAYVNQTIYGGAEMRLWLGNRRKHSTLDGWHMGLAAGGGIYDLCWCNHGYQGEAVSGFLNIGWQHRLGRKQKWLIDLGIGGGVLYTHYREYYGSKQYPVGHTEADNDHKMWQRNGHMTWLGAPHINISIGKVF